jgi:predicted nucleic acid-binding protein
MMGMQRDLGMLVSTALFYEYEEVLTRPEQRLAHGLRLDEVEIVLQNTAALTEPIEVWFKSRPATPDPGDEMVLECAISGRADAILTHNLRHFQSAHSYGIKVQTPGQFLQEVDDE